MALVNGTKLGPYEILSKLGEGGMGEVYKAKDPRLEREVAVKVLTGRLAQDQGVLTRFQRESKIIASLSHPNIRAIYDFGSNNGLTYAVMEMLEGETLENYLEHSAFDWKKALQLALPIAEGLAAAHGKGIIHRDIKPSNIFLTADGGVKILDFGIAQSKTKDSQEEDATSTLTGETLPGVVMGTIPYMSPEQVCGQQADARSDIFAFGTVLYEMLTGDCPFFRKTPAETVAAILNGPPPSLKESGIHVPEELQRVVTHCLEKNPADRFQSVRDLIFILRGIGHGISSRVQKGFDASVAVLPFVNLSSDKESEYFGDGLAEELINSLFRIEGLNVASRTSAFSFKGKNPDIRQIGEQLNVQTVLEGSVRKSGNRLRITAQLINVADGYHLWSEIFDRELEDVFAIQHEIAHSITRALQVVLSKKEKNGLLKAPTINVEAYDFCLRGRQVFYQFSREGFEQAKRLLACALELDSGYATAYAWVAYCYSFLYTWFDASESNLNKADKASLKALKLDPELAEAHVSRGMALSLKKKFKEAQKEFEIALKQKPELFEASYFNARLCFGQGELEKAVPFAEQANLQRPEDYNAPYLLGMIYSGLDREDEAQMAYRKSMEAAKNHVELFPKDARALYVGAAALVRMGENKRGLEWVERVLVINPEEPMTLYGTACTLALLGQTERALDSLEKVIALGTFQKKWLENDPDIDSLRNHPRFKALLKRL